MMIKKTMVEVLPRLLRSARLSAWQPEIEPLLTSSIRLHLQPIEEGLLPRGVTKFGGQPDLPPKLWPTYQDRLLPFIGQIQLTETTPYDEDHLLPSEGLLTFFLDIQQFFASWPRDRLTWRVLYTHDTSMAYWGPEQLFIAEQRYPTCTVKFYPEVTLPSYSSYDLSSTKRLGLPTPFTAEEGKAYSEIRSHLRLLNERKWSQEMNYPSSLSTFFQQILSRSGSSSSERKTLHRLLGHADPLRWDLYSELPDDMMDWQLLLQIDSDNALEMEGRINERVYYWIRKDHLSRLDFSHVWLIVQR